MASPPQPRSRGDFGVAIICALVVEASYVQSALDICWDQKGVKFGKAPGDQNAYTTGVIGSHNVVLVHMPHAGNTTAAAVSAGIRSSFTNIQLALVVGICGAVPFPIDTDGDETLLGDVLISTAMIQYDLGKQYPNGFRRTMENGNTLLSLRPEVAAQISRFKTRQNMEGLRQQLAGHLASLQAMEGSRASYPGATQDHLYQSSYVHQHRDGGPNCSKCQNDEIASCPRSCEDLSCEHDQLVPRKRIAMIRESNTNQSGSQHTPVIRFGRFGSANTVMKSGADRDRIALAEGIVAFEMEGAGVWNAFPTVVVKSACDYADSHKNKGWQEYAATVAAACAKAFLGDYVTPELMTEQVPILSPEANINSHTNTVVDDEARKAFLRGLALTDPVEDKSAIRREKGERVEGTCRWILDELEFADWARFRQNSPQSDILWLCGGPSSGKTTIATFLADELQLLSLDKPTQAVIYYFCNDSYATRRTAASILRGLLLQLARLDEALLGIIKHEHDTHQDFDNFDTLWTTFMKALLHSPGKRIYCIIDALDECESSSRETILKQIRGTFKPGLNQSDNIRILITSRHYPEIQTKLSRYPRIVIHDCERSLSDIKLFIRTKLEEVCEDYPSSLEEEVAEILREKSEGTFLWIGLACQELDGVAARDAIDTINLVPEGLHSLYRKLLDDAATRRKPKRHVGSSVTDKILNILMVSRRPLQVLELAAACGLYPDKDEETRRQFTIDEINDCRLLATVSREDRVYLLHQSVRDFLMDHFGGELAVRKAHASLAFMCIDHVQECFNQWKSTGLQVSRRAFWDYASNDWMGHARAAESEFKVTGSAVDFFSVKSPAREFWVELVAGSAGLIFPGQSVLEIAVAAKLPFLVDYILQDPDAVRLINRDCLTLAIHAEQLSIFFRLVEGPGADEKIVGKMVTTAVLYLQLETLDLLLDQTSSFRLTDRDWDIVAFYRPDNMGLLLKKFRGALNITDIAVLNLARTGDRGTFELLLSRCKHVSITPDVVSSAARNYYGIGVLQLLRERCAGQFLVDDQLLQTAARNIYIDETEMATLLSWCDLAVTEDLVIAATRPQARPTERIRVHQDKKIILLIERCNKPLSKKCLAIFAAESQKAVFSPATIKLCIDRSDLQSAFDEEALTAFVSNDYIMECLLSEYEEQITFTQKVIQEAARTNSHVLNMILTRCKNNMTVTEDVVISAAASVERTWKEATSMELLLDYCSGVIPITEKVIITAAANPSEGLRILEILLEQCPNKFVVSESVLVAAASNPGHAVKILEFLLAREPEATITGKIVRAAAANKCGRFLPMETLIQHCVHGLPVTDEVVLICAANHRRGPDLLAMLLDYYGSRITIDEETMKAVVRGDRGDRVLDVILRRRGEAVPITENFLIAAARYHLLSRTMLKMLLDSYGERVVITDRVFEAAAGNPWARGECLEFLKERCGHNLGVTGQMFMAAAESGTQEAFEMLLEWKGPEKSEASGEALLEAAAVRRLPWAKDYEFEHAVTVQEFKALIMRNLHQFS